MHVVTERRINEFCKRHPDASPGMRHWITTMRNAKYGGPVQMLAEFPSADIIKGELTVFNIGGNKYRLVVNMAYDIGRVFVQAIFTHAEYSRVKIASLFTR
jgi:mRNA interferase HigB